MCRRALLQVMNMFVAVLADGFPRAEDEFLGHPDEEYIVMAYSSWATPTRNI